jgi:glycosyltransferase involved in cell wall biosynthesis
MMCVDEQRSAPDLRGLRVLIAHDWLVAWAGSERCVDEMLRIFPDADLVAGVVAPSMRQFNAMTRRAEETWLARLPGARTHHRWFLPLEGLAFASLDTRKYDLIISSSHAFSKMVRRGPHAVHVCYCYSPPRYLWDLSATYRRDARGIQRLALVGALGGLRRMDRWSARGVDHFISISRYIADRVQRCYGRRADVVYPPVTAKPWSGPMYPRENFILSLGRLVPYKRVDLIVQAAERLGVRLVVAGDGPDRSRLEALAGPHTEFVGAVSEEAAAKLFSTCAAFVFCAEEDFGIAPVEANAHGAPVVGFGRGGLLETMRPDVTAEFFYEQTVDAVADAIERTLSRSWQGAELRANAERFSPVAFRRDFIRSIEMALGTQAQHETVALA